MKPILQPLVIERDPARFAAAQEHEARQRHAERAWVAAPDQCGNEGVGHEPHVASAGGEQEHGRIVLNERTANLAVDHRAQVRITRRRPADCLGPRKKTLADEVENRPVQHDRTAEIGVGPFSSLLDCGEQEQTMVLLHQQEPDDDPCYGAANQRRNRQLPRIRGSERATRRRIEHQGTTAASPTCSWFKTRSPKPSSPRSSRSSMPRRIFTPGAKRPIAWTPGTW
jgi:hypothetical protein